MTLSYPKYATIQTVSYCNASCLICPYRDTKNTQSQGKMSKELFKKIIDELSHYHLRRILLYLMNEPLMDEDIVNKINYTKKMNPDTIVHIVSNGSLLNESLSNQIINSRLDYIEFSILANTTESYRKIMGLDYEKTKSAILNFIQMAKENGKPRDYININITNTPNFLSENERNDMIDFWKKQYVHEVRYYDHPNSRAGNSSLIPRAHHKTIHGCKSIWTNEMVHILYDGTVIPCCMDWRREVVLGNVNEDSIGNIYQDSIKNIWLNGKEWYFRKKTIRYNPKDPFFKLFGNDIDNNGCYSSCDNLGLNLAIHHRLQEMSSIEKIVIKAYVSMSNLADKIKGFRGHEK